MINIITKYFNTINYDLCKDNCNKKGNFGKHIIIKYTKQIKQDDAINLINNIINEVQMTPICDMLINFKDNYNFDILQPIAESHISIHKTQKDSYIDVFSCKYFDENKILEILDNNYENIFQIQRGIYYK